MLKRKDVPQWISAKDDLLHDAHLNLEGLHELFKVAQVCRSVLGKILLNKGKIENTFCKKEDKVLTLHINI